MLKQIQQQAKGSRKKKENKLGSVNIESFPSDKIKDSKSKLRDDGFEVFPNFFNKDTVSCLNERLEYVLRGQYDRGSRPDKTPRRVRASLPNFVKNVIKETYQEINEIKNGVVEEKASFNNQCSSSNNFEEKKVKCKIDEGKSCDKSKNEIEKLTKKKKSSKAKKAYRHFIGPLGFSGNLENVKVMQIINVHKSDSIFREIVTNPVLGQLVTKLTGWKGVRLAQDQIWAKPPGAPPLVYHRDSPYFMFTPPDVITVWVALDNMEDEIGPLIYVKGSHKWGDGRVGTSQDFFQHDGGKDLLQSAAKREGITDPLEMVSMSGLQAGGISIHDGRTWHGSSKNFSDWKPRRGLGIHYVPSNVRWTNEACKSVLWKKYVKDIHDNDLTTLKLPEEDFPLVWERKLDDI